MASPKLPPLPDEAFDGEKHTTEIQIPKCPHKQVKIENNELRCTCGAAWTGTGIHELYKLMTS